MGLKLSAITKQDPLLMNLRQQHHDVKNLAHWVVAMSSLGE